MLGAMKPGVRRNIGVCLVGVALCLLYYAPELPRAMVELGDGSHHFFPAKAELSRKLKSGQFPLWNAKVGLGFPFTAETESGVFYPTVALYALLPIKAAYVTDILGHVFLCFFFTFLYCRAFDRSLGASVLAGAIYAFGGYAAIHHSRTAMIDVLPWLPAACLALERFRRQRSIRYVIWAGGALGLAALAGHPQSSLYVWLAVGLHTAIVSALNRDGRLLFAAGAAFVVGGGLAAIQILPVLSIMPYLNRKPLTLAQSSVGSFRPHMLVYLVNPRLTFEAFIGLLPLLLAGYALFRFRDLSRPVRAWVAVGAVGFLLMLGNHAPLHALSRYIPGMVHTRFPIRHVLYVTLAVALLAAATVDLLREPDAREKTWNWLRRHGWWLLCGLIIVGALLDDLGDLGRRIVVQTASHQKTIGAASDKGGGIFHAFPYARPAIVSIAIAAASVMGFLLLLRRRKQALWLLPMLFLVDSRTAVGPMPGQPGIAEDPLQDSPMLKVIKKRPDGEGARVIVDIDGAWGMYEGLEHHDLWPNMPPLKGLVSLQISGPMQPRYYTQALSLDEAGAITERGLVKQTNLLSLLGARFLVLGPEAQAAAKTVEAMRAPAPPPQVLAKIAAAKGKPIDLRTTRGRGLALFQKKAPLAKGKHWIQLTARVSAGGEAAEEDLIVALVKPEWAETPKLVIPGQELTGEPREFSKLFRVQLRTPGAMLRVYTRGGAPIVLWKARAISDPLPRVGPLPGVQEKPGQVVPMYHNIAASPAGALLTRYRADLPRVRLATRGVNVASPEKALAKIPQLVDPRRTALVEGKSQTKVVHFSPGTAAVARDTGDKLTITTKAKKGRGLLIVADQYLPGWRATVNGQPSPIYRAYGFMRAVLVPKGKAVVRMTYHPPGLLAGMVITFATAGLCLMLLLVGGRRRPGPQPAAETAGATSSGSDSTESDETAEASADAQEAAQSDEEDGGRAAAALAAEEAEERTAGDEPAGDDRSSESGDEESTSSDDEADEEQAPGSEKLEDDVKS